MRVLMCRPDYFDIEYEINPWMDVHNKVNHQKALQQWQSVYDTYRTLGVDIELIPQVKGLPDMTFTANAGVVRDATFISANFRHAERKGEETYFQKWFTDHEFTVRTLNHYQGGEGDALFFRDTLYMGYGFRSDLEAHKEIANLLNVKTVSLHLIDPFFYDFDTAFCPIGDKVVLYYPEAFDIKSRKLLERMKDTIPMTQIQAEHFVGNSVYIDGKILVGYLDEDLKKELKKLNIEPIVLDMSEFKKSGGGIKCLTLFLDH